MQENETKIYELVYKGSKSHGIIYHSHPAHKYKYSHANNSAKKSKGVNFAFNQDKGQNRKHS